MKKGLWDRFASHLDLAELRPTRLRVRWCKEVQFRQPVLQTRNPPDIKALRSGKPFWEAHASLPVQCSSLPSILATPPGQPAPPAPPAARACASLQTQPERIGGSKKRPRRK